MFQIPTSLYPPCLPPLEKGEERKERSLLQETVFFINFIVILTDSAFKTLGPGGRLRHFWNGGGNLQFSIHGRVHLQERVPNLLVLFLQHFPGGPGLDNNGETLPAQLVLGCTGTVRKGFPHQFFTGKFD